MKDILCLNIDAESDDGVPIAKRFAVNGYPALLLLNADGLPQDHIMGYIKPDAFKKEIQRIRSGTGTADDLKKQVAKDGKNIELRSKLANKLKDLGDKQSYEAQMAEIKKLDPEGKSLPMHRMALDKVIREINAGWEKNKSLDTKALAEYLAKETYGEILWQGWNSMISMQNFLADQASKDDKDDEAKKLQVEIRKSMRSAWKYVPAEAIPEFGNNLAFMYWDARDEINADDKAFALEVAKKTVEAAKDEVNVIDTYACCLYMNGKVDDALKQVARCIELDPKNKDWTDRQSQFQTGK